jgi:hypothetical protein
MESTERFPKLIQTDRQEWTPGIRRAIYRTFGSPLLKAFVAIRSDPSILTPLQRSQFDRDPNQSTDRSNSNRSTGLPRHWPIDRLFLSLDPIDRSITVTSSYFPAREGLEKV